jgi:hypothetical protein
MLMLGEVRTCLLHNAAPLPPKLVDQVLATVPGRRVLSRARPIAHAVSPDVVTGVDCRLATPDQTRARGIGTVTAQALLTSGLVLQGSAHAGLRRAETSARLPWSHYASQRGIVEVISRAEAADLAAGYLADASPGETIDLGSISERLIGDIQGSPELDHITTVRSRPTRVRWAAVVADVAAPTAHVRVEDDVVRTVAITVPADQLGEAARFCEDFALHDWLLTALDQLIDASGRQHLAGRDPIDTLCAVVERLFHLWMPGALVAPGLASLWEGLERHPGYSRQWNAQVARVRDQITLQMLRGLRKTARASTDW